ncbi:UNC93-like protein MFSD11 [Diabrotica virgifera virgifera]|uniref:UNC93-like protein MFSD11 n=1 Tax=Diabrotica virgifera virgifera TaxID=50390 RepID=A0ABM5ICN9_DIAVI|nr:UNC93-like protein MFSD11 [Diabrotica virgifera virgifera]
MDRSLRNVMLLGLAFMLVFTAFQTMSNIQQTITDSIVKDDPTYDGDAYYSQAIIYGFFSLFNWSAPSVVSIIGPKFSMFLGGTVYVAFILQFLAPKAWGMYLCSALLGIGAAMIWTGQGNYLTLNSTKKYITRNSGIFWALLQLSMFVGNTFVFFAFKGKTEVDKSTRTFVIITLAAIGAVGLIVLFVLPKAFKEEEDEEEEVEEAKPQGPVEAFLGSVRLFFTMRMFLLNFAFLYTGLELGFFSAIYSSCLGFTKNFENRKELVGISGIFMGLGEVLGGGIFGIFGHKTVKWGRDPVVSTGFLLHILAFVLIFLNLPNNSPFADTDDNAIITSNAILAIFCSFLLGLGDSIYNTQIFSLLGTVYADNSAPAFAIFKFSQSLGAVITFVSAKSLGLHYQLAILLVMSVVGTLCFIKVEWYAKKKAALLSAEKSGKSEEALTGPE